VYCQLNQDALIVRIHEDQICPAVGATVRIKPRADRTHRFDASTGKRLS
jgi:hypothetical protein